MTPAKGKSPLDKKRKPDESFNGSVTNSIEKKILAGDFCMPGMTKAETKAAYRAWQKNFRIEQQLTERWYREQVRDNNPQADVT
jgi:hypothetical protein